MTISLRKAEKKDIPTVFRMSVVSSQNIPLFAHWFEFYLNFCINIKELGDYLKDVGPKWTLDGKSLSIL